VVLFAKLIGSFINGITLLGWSVEVVYGLCNLRIVSAIKGELSAGTHAIHGAGDALARTAVYAHSGTANERVTRAETRPVRRTTFTRLISKKI
jgi:hypothetical protein